MPTVLDSFLIELGFDTRQLEVGRRQAESTVRQLRASGAATIPLGLDERGVRSAFQRVSTELTRLQGQARREGLTPLLREEIGKTTQGMRLLQQQAQTMGVSIQMGAQRATSGVAALTAAGLNAYAVFKLLDGVYHRVVDTAGRVTAAGQVAGYTGLATPRARAIARGAAVATGTPEEATGQALFGIRQRVAEQAVGGAGYVELQRTLSLLSGAAGIAQPTPGRTDEETFERILRFLGPALSKLSQPQQQLYGGMLGLPQRLTEALGRGTTFDELAARGANVTATKEQTEALDALTRAMRAFDAAISGMTEKIAADLSPVLTRVVTGITKMITDLQQTPAGRAAFGTVLLGGASGIFAAISALFKSIPNPGAVTTVITALTRMFTVISGFAAGASLADLAMQGQRPLTEPLPSSRAQSTPEIWKDFFGFGSHPPSVDRPSIWHPSTWFKGGAGATPGQQGAAESDNSIKAGIDFFTGKGLTQEQAAGVVSRLAHESGGGTKLDPNAVNPTSGAYGIAQWLGGRKPAATATGGDLNKQLDLVWKEMQTTENSAFRKIQGTKTAAEAATAMEAFERAGNPSFTHRAASAANRFLGVGSAQAGTLPPGVARNSRGEMYSIQGTTMTPAESAQNDASMAWIKSHKGGIWSAQAASVQRGAGSSSTITNNAPVSVTVGDIHTQEADAKGIAQDLHQELRDRLTVDQMNVGLF